MVYGSEAVLPTDLEYGSPRLKAYNEQSNKETRENAVDQLEEARDMALLNSARYQQKLRRYHDKHVRSERGRRRPTVSAKQSRTPQADSTLGGPIRSGRGLEAEDIQASGRKRGDLHQRVERTATSILPLEFQSFMFLCTFCTKVL